MLPSVSAPARVLIVDKDPVLLEELRMATHSEGWVCATARGVGAALAVATEHRPQVAVVAYILPDGNANDLICELRRRNPSVLSILMADRPDLENAIGEVSARAFAYLIKPFPPLQLNALIRSAVETTRLREELQEEIIRIAQMQAILETVRLMQDCINNPLQGIMANAELMQMVEPDLSPRAREILGKVTRGCEAVGDIIHRLAWVLSDCVLSGEGNLASNTDGLLGVLRGCHARGCRARVAPGPVPQAKTPGEERRREPRYCCTTLMLSAPVDGATRWVLVDNISTGGVGLRLLSGDLLPSRFHARLWNLESRESIPVDVEVRWVRAGDPTPAGLRFVKEDAHEFLKGMLSRIHDPSGAKETREACNGCS
ncbi:MAG TPA: response regulator [Armatimonadetes bacterium]|nr:response regulator [Armatimonadota bacterium]